MESAAGGWSRRDEEAGARREGEEGGGGPGHASCETVAGDARVRVRVQAAADISAGYVLCTGMTGPLKTRTPGKGVALLQQSVLRMWARWMDDGNVGRAPILVSSIQVSSSKQKHIEMKVEEEFRRQKFRINATILQYSRLGKGTIANRKRRKVGTSCVDS